MPFATRVCLEDLIKAFNTFGRFAILRIMTRMGVPVTVINAWVASLDRLTRFPCVNGHFAEGIPSTTGVPEGCSISVLAMIATSTVFYFRMKNESIDPFAYADNWSWMSKVQRAHFEAFDKVRQLAHVMRFMIDFRKSWHWSTSKPFRDACEMLDPTDGVPQTVMTCVKDLGELVHYNKSVSLGFIKEKIEEGINRIQRIGWLPCSLQKKALYIQTSVWPLSLYSSDTTYIGQTHFVKLRRAVLNAIVGNWHSASSTACCNFLSKFLVDPFLYTLCQCAGTIRRLSTVAPDLAKQTIQKAATFDGTRPCGPATALKQYLAQVQWSLDEHGNIEGPDHLRCNLLYDSVRVIVNKFHAMWLYHLTWSMDRKGVGDFIPDNRLSMRVFASFPDEMQQLLKLNMVGGFQTQSMKAKWNKDISDLCPICGKCDTREHRLLDCVASQKAREQFPEASQILLNGFICPFQDNMRCVCFLEPAP